jgi:hypothetical protein
VSNEKQSPLSWSGSVQVAGVFPHLAVLADTLPIRTETGIGALMPWAEKLWFVTYVSSKRNAGGGTGLFTVDADLTLTKRPESVVGCYANRMIHPQSHQLIIGPHIIDHQGNVRNFEALTKDVRLTAVMEHLEDPENKVYFLGMEGEFFEADVHTLEARWLMDVTKELGIKERPHFKGAYTGQGRVVVANNTYQESDYLGQTALGRLAEWDGDRWTIIETCQFNAVTGRRTGGGLSHAIFATGADNASAILKVRLNDEWQTYRLPKGTHTQDHTITTEWPRIREVESERWLMNCSGMFYELPAMTYGGKVWGVRPICTHLRIIGDFCSWRGLLVLAGDQTTPIWDANAFVGQPQANLWFGITDDLWRFGKPKGWGGPWRKTRIEADQPSDPFLMTGFEHKCLHLSHDAERVVSFRVEVDFEGDGSWHAYELVDVPAKGYAHYEFPAGFSAHWVRVVSSASCQASAILHYT